MLSLVPLNSSDSRYINLPDKALLPRKICCICVMTDHDEGSVPLTIVRVRMSLLSLDKLVIASGRDPERQEGTAVLP